MCSRWRLEWRGSSESRWHGLFKIFTPWVNSDRTAMSTVFSVCHLGLVAVKNAVGKANAFATATTVAERTQELKENHDALEASIKI
ncbi:hypothetical protein ALON55S_06730 [Alishewanella longhuensis]